MDKLKSCPPQIPECCHVIPRVVMKKHRLRTNQHWLPHRIISVSFRRRNEFGLAYQGCRFTHVMLGGADRLNTISCTLVLGSCVSVGECFLDGIVDSLMLWHVLRCVQRHSLQAFSRRQLWACCIRHTLYPLSLSQDLQTDSSHYEHLRHEDRNEGGPPTAHPIPHDLKRHRRLFHATLPENLLFIPFERSLVSSGQAMCALLTAGTEGPQPSPLPVQSAPCKPSTGFRRAALPGKRPLQ